MKKHFPFVVLLLLASCTLETEPQMPSDEPLVPKKIIHAVTESDFSSSNNTKVFADEDLKVLWNAGDRISVFDMTTYNHPYLFLGEDKDTAGDFEDQTTSRIITGNPVPYIYAVYPYKSSNKLDNKGVFTVTIPAEQSYKEKSFGIGANTMVAVSEDGFLAFKNVGGYLTFRLYGDNVSIKSFTIQSNNGEKIAGKASVSMPLGGLPAATMDATATDAISIVCDPAVKIGESPDDYTEFWFVIPPVTFSGGFTMTITDDQGGIFTKSTAKSLTIVRNIRTPVGAIEVVPDYAASIIQFEDPDFLAALLDLNIDTNGDGMISRNEAAEVEKITVCTDNISSLGGIEFFTNLKVLNATGSLIETKSSNARYAGQLESIELGQLFLLEELDVHGNKLEEIDVSNNPELNTLICTDNPLEDIILAPGQIIAQLESPEDTEIVEIWGEGIDPASFPDPYFREYVFENFDTDNSGFLSEAECDAVTRITIYTENVYSLEGIGYFRNLKNLTCTPNFTSMALPTFYDANGNVVIGSLASLDLSNNTLLQYLDCEGNQLTTLSMAQNQALYLLDCRGNQLTSLDVSDNSALEVLFCHVNQLAGLDVSNNVNLVTLHCHSNLLTSLDVSNNTKLTSLIVGSNPLSSLDVSHNTKLVELSCFQNQLQSLDVSNNVDLTWLYCFSNQLTDIDVSRNTELIRLVCYDNQLSSLDVSNNPSLEWLLCDNNKLVSLDVSSNTALTDLSCDKNQMASLDVSSNTALTYLSCVNSMMQYLYLAEGQEIASLSKHNNTTIIYKSPNPVPADEIWYTSTTENVIEPCEWGGGFGEASIVSNTYADGKGIIKFDRPLIQIGTSAFAECNFKTVILPEGLTTIGDFAFGYCRYMTSITFPSTLTSIEGAAMRDCYSLTSITIPQSVTNLEDGAFENCSSLLSFNGKFASDDHRWLIVDGIVKAVAPAGMSSFTIPSGVTTIGGALFLFCDTLESITIPDSVTRIEDMAFLGCSSLTSVTIPESVTYIGLGAFVECASLQAFYGKFASDDHRCLVVDGTTVGFAPAGLTDYTVPSGVNYIAYSTFEACGSLTSITVPASVNRIGSYAFTSCSSLTSLVFDSVTPPVLETTYAFNYTNCTFLVPANSVDAYKEAQNWSQFADRIQPRAAIPEVVDLGLSVKWASFNLGATAPEEYGNYYAWGETVHKSQYAWNNYIFNPSGDGSTFTKYIRSDYSTLQSMDDAAQTNLGGTWRMPTKDEWLELKENCNVEWNDNYNNSGIKGYLFTSKMEGFTENSIFLPAADMWLDSSPSSFSQAYYWSSSLSSSTGWAFNVYFDSSFEDWGDMHKRYIGFPVRPVMM